MKEKGEPLSPADLLQVAPGSSLDRKESDPDKPEGQEGKQGKEGVKRPEPPLLARTVGAKARTVSAACRGNPCGGDRLGRRRQAGKAETQGR